MKEYYSKRAQEYEKIYHRDDPVRHAELAEISRLMQELFFRLDVLEVACGTGYWTERIARSARSVTAVDISEETLRIARQKNIEGAEVRFIQGDAYRSNEIDGKFNAGCANFWFSHIPKSRINEFLDQFHERLGRDSVVFFADNNYVEGIGGKLIKKENDENTYKVRGLSNGTVYEIIKNYYNEDELGNIFEPRSKGLKIHMGECFWWLRYRVS
ncbi:MAG: class I SAM-dependent methyltransferase [Clostridiaceae bacterium]|nr:class I SAM-dependent methyltransferase [Clostridiaceae bacterium]